MKSALLLCALQTLSFFVVTLNYRYVAKGHVALVVLSDAGICLLNFTLFKLITSANTTLEAAGYIVGGCIGSYLGMRATKGIEDK